MRRLVVVATVIASSPTTRASPSADRAPVTLTHVITFSLAGMIGTRFGLDVARELLGSPRRLRVVVAWIWIYGLVAQQMAWIFRPHFHATTVFMRPLNSGGSALQSLAEILFHWLR